MKFKVLKVIQTLEQTLKVCQIIMNGKETSSFFVKHEQKNLAVGHSCHLADTYRTALDYVHRELVVNNSAGVKAVYDELEPLTDYHNPIYKKPVKKVRRKFDRVDNRKRVYA